MPYVLVPCIYFTLFLWSLAMLFAYEEHFGDEQYGIREEALDWYAPESMTSAERGALFVHDYAIDFPVGVIFWGREGESPPWRLFLWLPNSLLVAYVFDRGARRILS